MINTDMAIGDSMETKEKTSRYYFINLEEVHWDQNSGVCMTYGEGQNFKSYADCMENEQSLLFDQMLGCRVPWLSAPGNSEDFCHGRMNVTEETFNAFKGNISKIVMSTKSGEPQANTNCLKPCAGINVYSKLTKEEATRATDELILNFQQSVKVIRHVQHYGVFELLVEVGSCLWLWVGLSALGLFDLLLDVYQTVAKRLTGK